jgi:hypothetical protein
LLNVGGSLIPTISVDVDFNTANFTAPSVSLSGSVLWDVAIWDVSSWPSNLTNFTNWLSVNALGKAMALRLQANVSTGLNFPALAIFDVGQFDLMAFDTAIPSALPVLQVNVFNAIVEMGGAI